MYFSNQFRMTCFCHHSKDWEAKFYKNLRFNNNYMIKLMPQRDIIKTDQ